MPTDTEPVFTICAQPCPFCGAEGAVPVVGDAGKWGSLECAACEARGPSVRIDYRKPQAWVGAATLEWNGRGSAEAPEDKRELSWQQRLAREALDLPNLDLPQREDKPFELAGPAIDSDGFYRQRLTPDDADALNSLVKAMSGVQILDAIAEVSPAPTACPPVKGSSEQWGCWTIRPRPHPFLQIEDMACGYGDKLTDPRCKGCHRSRKGWPSDQEAPYRVAP